MSRICIPVKDFNGDKWADLCALCLSHEIVGETVKKKDENFSFIGGHRVRRYKFTKNVHFKVPFGTQLDITAVPPGNPPRRQGGR
jgi:hypothetical protein